MIRSSKHSVLCANRKKLDNLCEFISEYRRVSQIIVDYIWENGCQEGKYEFSISENKLDMPSMLSSDIIQKAGIETSLTGRALKCCITQCCGMIKAEIKKQKCRIYVYKKKKSEGVPRVRLEKLIKRIKQNIPVKPNCSNINPELNSICMDIQDGDHFDKFVRLKSIFKDKREIYLPIRFHRKANSLQKKSIKMLNSIMVNEKYLNLRWEIPNPPKKESGSTLGADQGYKDVLNLANESMVAKTPNTCAHNHSLESIIDKVSRKKKGSKAFARAKQHQKNFINWSLNQIDLSNVKQINLEKIWNIGYKNRTSRKMSHWQNTLIRDKVIDLCETNGVHFVEQDCTYKSQRCFACGSTRKSNREGKVYQCKNCGNIDDADENAAKNNSINLPEIPYNVRNLKLNMGNGFFWNPDGLFDFEGRSLQSLLQVEN